MILLFTAIFFSKEIKIADFEGYWEGINVSSANPNYRLDAKMNIKVNRENTEVFYWGGDFKIPMTAAVSSDMLLLSTYIQGYTFSATYTMDKNDSNILKGEISRKNPDGTAELRKGELHRFDSDNTGFALDIDYMKNVLPKVHKNLFFKVSKEKFDESCDDLIKVANSLSHAELFLGIKKILALVDDPHTNIYGFGNYINEYYPFVFKKIGLEYHVFATTREYKDILGAKLISIGGNDEKQILNKLEKIIPAQSGVRVAFEAEGYLNSPLALEFCNITDKNNEVFIFEKDGKQIEINPVRLSLNAFKQNMVTLKWSLSLAEKRANEFFFYEFFEEDSILYFQYNVCSDNTQNGLPKFSQIQDEILQLLKAKNIKKLIVDMRYNSGGNSAYGTELAKQIQKLNVDTDVYVVIGNATFSSAIINTIDFKNYCSATLIGEPTASSPNHYGEVRTFILPNMAIMMQYSTKYFKLVEENTSYITPDITVNRDFNDYISGIDTVFEVIKGF